MKDKKQFTDKLKKQILEEIKKRGLNDLSLILNDARRKYLSKIKKYKIKDAEQSWKPFKGNFLEDVILGYIIEEIKKAGLEVEKGRPLEKARDDKLGECLSLVKRKLAIDYGEFGLHLPDADLIIYDPKECKPIAVISSKATLRERIAQTAYWSIKLKQGNVTRNIKVLFITLDEDKDLKLKEPAKKGRAIAEIDIDCTYVITDDEIEESDKVKKIDKFFDDLKKFV